MGLQTKYDLTVYNRTELLTHLTRAPASAVLVSIHPWVAASKGNRFLQHILAPQYH